MCGNLGKNIALRQQRLFAVGFHALEIIAFGALQVEIGRERLAHGLYPLGAQKIVKCDIPFLFKLLDGVGRRAPVETGG